MKKNKIPSRVGKSTILRNMGMFGLSSSGRGYLIAATMIATFLLANYASSPVYAPVNSEILSDGMLDQWSEPYAPYIPSSGVGTPASIGELR